MNQLARRSDVKALVVLRKLRMIRGVDHPLGQLIGFGIRKVDADATLPLEVIGTVKSCPCTTWGQLENAIYYLLKMAGVRDASSDYFVETEAAKLNRDLPIMI